MFHCEKLNDEKHYLDRLGVFLNSLIFSMISSIILDKYLKN